MNYELITETSKKYPRHSNGINLWEKGLESVIFFLLLHGREHLNVLEFMSALQAGDNDVYFGFNNRMPGSMPKNPEIGAGNSYVEALRCSSDDDKQERLNIIRVGLNLFKKLFCYRSGAFIPSNYIRSPHFNKSVSKRGVCFIQGRRKLKESIKCGSVNYQSNYRRKRNQFGQRCLVRSSAIEAFLFKPAINDHTNSCLKEISATFRMKKPAIITSHKIKYVGFIDKLNHDRNLKQLQILLKKTIQRWLDVELMNSAELYRLIEGDRR